MGLMQLSHPVTKRQEVMDLQKQSSLAEHRMASNFSVNPPQEEELIDPAPAATDLLRSIFQRWNA